MSTFAGPRSSRAGSVHYPEQPAYYASSRGAPSVVYGNDARSEVRDPRTPRSASRSRRHSVSAQPRPIIVPHSGPRSSVDFAGPPPRASVDFREPGRGSPPGRRSSIHISDSTGGPRNSSASLRRHDDHRDSDRERDRTRPGTTRFPRKFVNRDAVEEAGWPFEEDRETGAIVVFKALSKKEIDTLVERTAHIRKRRAEGGPQRPTITAAAGSPTRLPTKPHHSTTRLTEDRDKHVAFSPERTTVIHQTDAPPKSISAATPVTTRFLSRDDERRRAEELEDLSMKAKSEMEARARAEELARSVRIEAPSAGPSHRGGHYTAHGGSHGRRLGRDVVVVR